MQVLRLILIRHAETLENVSGIVQGHSAGCLSERGKKQASQIALRLKDERLDAIYSSDLERSFQTAKILIQDNAGYTVITDQRLREQNFGIYEGKPVISMLRKIRQEKVDLLRFNPEKGEPSGDFQRRVRELFEEIKAKHFGHTVVLVTHFGVINVLLNILLDKTIEKMPQNEISHGKIIILNINYSGSVNLEVINCVERN